MNSELIAQRGWVLVIQVSLLLVLGLAATAFVKKKGAAWQTNVLRTTLAACLVLVCFGSISHRTLNPVWAVPTPSTGPTVQFPSPSTDKPTHRRLFAGSSAMDSSVNTMPSSRISLNSPKNEDPSLSSAIVPTRASAPISLRDTVVLLWLAGVAFGSAWVFVGMGSLLRLRYSKSLPLDPTYTTLAQDLSKQIGVRLPKVTVSPRVASPFVSGIVRPTIYLPDTWRQQYDDDQLRAILTHELIHIRNRDCLWGCVARLACIVAWPHPLMWVMQRKMNTTSEELCDQIVLSTGLKATNYADCLVRIAELARPSRVERLIGVGVVPIRSTLGRRISLVLNSSRNTATRVSLGSRVAIAGCICLAVAGIGFAIAPRHDGAAGKAAAQRGDPNAMAFLKKVADTYAQLSSLSANITIHSTNPSESRVLSLDYMRPATSKIVVMKRDQLVPAESLYTEPERIYVTSPFHSGEYMVLKRATNPEWDSMGSLQIGLSAINVRGPSALGMLDIKPGSIGSMVGPGKFPWTYGPDVSADGVPCVTLVSKVKQQRQGLYVISWIISIADNLVREQKNELIQNGKSLFSSIVTYSHVRANIPMDRSALTFDPNRSWHAIAKGPYVREKLAPAVEAMKSTLASANTISYAVDETVADDGMDNTGLIYHSQNHYALTVQTAKPGKTHFKLELKEYPGQGLEGWNDGAVERVVQQRNAHRYLEAPVTPMTDLIDEVGRPGNACSSGFDMLRWTKPRQALGYFQGVQAKPTVFQGEPVDVVVERPKSEDQYGFPLPDSGTTTLFISRRDHLLRKVETTYTYKVDRRSMRNLATEIFRHVKLDTPISDSVFTFTPPRGMTATSDVTELEPVLLTAHSSIDETLLVGQQAPDFNSTLLDGTPVALRQFRGKVVFIHGWELHMTNNETDLPLYEKLFGKFKDKGLVMLGIPNEPKGSRPAIVDWLRKHAITHPQLFDEKGEAGGIEQTYRNVGRTFVFIIDRNGIVYAKPSFAPNYEQLIQAALDKKN